MNAGSYSDAEIHIFMPAWLWLCLPVGFFFGGGGNVTLCENQSQIRSC